RAQRGMSVPRRSPRVQMIDGQPRSIFLDAGLVRAALRFKPRDGDIIQVTYPKSGTHWVQQITQLILNKGESVANFTEFVKKSPFLEYHGEQAFEGMSSPRTIRTHFPLTRENFNKNAKYVYVARNPWDCCVSFYHHVRSLPLYEFQDGTFDEFFEAYMKGCVGYGNYFDHVLSGYSRKDEPNVFFITYEALKKDTPGSVLALAYFLGEDYGRLLEQSDELFQKVLRKSSPEFMKKVMEVDFKELMATFHTNRNPATDISDPTKQAQKNGPATFNFVRKGKVGDWKEHFTPEQFQRMRATIEEKSKGTNLMDFWQSDDIRFA
ncbi:salivary sulfotransferase, putative, partial [Ixodes scapularis]